MAREASVFSARVGTAHCDNAAIFRETVERLCGRLIARGKDGQGKNWQDKAHDLTTRYLAGLFRVGSIALLPALMAACQPPPDDRQFMPSASAERGNKIIDRVGCGSCHAIPGVGWPQGKVGPNLAGLAERALIAGTLPNQPDILAAYIRNAPALVPGSGMPAMPLSEAEARDIAAYLYQAKEP